MPAWLSGYVKRYTEETKEAEKNIMLECAAAQLSDLGAALMLSSSKLQFAASCSTCSLELQARAYGCGLYQMYQQSQFFFCDSSFLPVCHQWSRTGTPKLLLAHSSVSTSQRSPARNKDRNLQGHRVRLSVNHLEET